jgi:hypothetical protein
MERIPATRQKNKIDGIPHHSTGFSLLRQNAWAQLLNFTNCIRAFLLNISIGKHLQFLPKYGKILQ